MYVGCCRVVVPSGALIVDDVWLTTPFARRAGAAASGHPWRTLQNVREGDAAGVPNAVAATLRGAQGQALGSGIFDRRDPVAAWRRFSWAEDVAFDAAYIADAMQEGLARRAPVGCQRLLSSDADYLPGLIVEQYEDVLTICAETAAVDAQLDVIADLLEEQFRPREIVLLNDCAARAAFGLEREVRSLSGRPVKPRWVEIDEVAYRFDWMQADKPRFYLDQREQHLLVGSLCEDRVVLDAFAHSGAFALQALRAGAQHVVATDRAPSCVKAIGAHAQRNRCFVEAIECDAAAFLAERALGEVDCIVLDPPQLQGDAWADLQALHRHAFRCLPSGGVLATYCRSSAVRGDAFEQMVAAAAAAEGREGRIFARTGQPFDFPTLLNLPESQALKGLILQVE